MSDSINKVTASAPGKLMLFGEHAVVYNHPAIVTAVDQRLYVEVEKHEKQLLEVIAPDLSDNNYSKFLSKLGTGDIPKEVKFIEMLCANFRRQTKIQEGWKIKTASDFSAKFGFGSSSAVTVALAQALNELYQVGLNKQQLFTLCYQTVLDVQGVGSGFDLAAAIWGGTIYYKKEPMQIIELTTEPLPTVVGYTGIKADTTNLVKQVAVLKEKKPHLVANIFDKIEAIVTKAEPAILAKNWQLVGELMNENQALLAQLGVSSPKLDTLIKASHRAGAAGAKLSGAGGGDCMVAVAPGAARRQAATALAAAGGQFISVTTSAPGVRIETSLNTTKINK